MKAGRLAPATILALGCLLTLALIWGLAVRLSWNEFHRAERTAALNGEKLARVLAESVELTARSLERDFARLDQAVARGESLTEAERASFREPSIVFTAWHRIGGSGTASSVEGLSRLEDIRWPPVEGKGAPFLSAGRPLRRTDGRADRVLVPFFHHVDDPKGGFTVAAVVDFSWIESFFSGVDNWGMTSVLLFSMDGTMLFRHPAPPRFLDMNFRGRIETFERADLVGAGSYRTVSRFDHRERMVVYRRIGDLPLLVVVNHEAASLFAPAFRHTVLRMIFALAGSLLILFFASLVLRLWRRIETEGESRRLFEQAARRHDRLEAVGRFSGALAHDFNNILTLTFGALDRLDSRTPATGDARILLDALSASAMRARDLVKQIRTFSRPTGAMPRTIDLKSFVEKTLLPPNGRGPFRIEVECGDPTPKVRMEAPILEQILLETLALPEEEASKFRVRIVLENEASSPMARMELDFIPLQPAGLFDRSASAVLREHLLLSSVRPLLENAGGWIEFRGESASPALSLLFPAAVARSEEKDGLDRRQWILFVDSEEAVVELVRDFLRGNGVKVFGTWDPAAALEEFRRRPDDFQMAISEDRQSGADLAHALREIRPELPLLLLTQAGRSAVTEPPLFPDENVILLEKPYRFPDLLREIRRMQAREKRGLTIRPLRP